MLIQNHLIYLHFNSIKVRLERSRIRNRQRIWQFQFHKGTIRTCGCAQACNPSDDYFNSIKVRLEHEQREPLKQMRPYFNSIKVRLEPLLGSQSSYYNQNFNSIKVRLEHFAVAEDNALDTISIP